MRDGRLDKAERNILQKAQSILDMWVVFHKDDEETDEFVVYLAEHGSGSICNFLNETKGE